MLDQTLLVRQAQNGDRDAFATLYDRYAPLVRAIAYDAQRQLRDDAGHHPGRVSQSVLPTAPTAGTQTGSAHGSRKLPVAPVATGSGAKGAIDTSFDRSRPTSRPRSTTIRPSNFCRRFGCLPYRERMALHIFYFDEQPAEMARKTLGLSSSGFYKLLERAAQRGESYETRSGVRAMIPLSENDFAEAHELFNRGHAEQRARLMTALSQTVSATSSQRFRGGPFRFRCGSRLPAC